METSDGLCVVCWISYMHSSFSRKSCTLWAGAPQPTPQSLAPTILLVTTTDSACLNPSTRRDQTVFVFGFTQGPSPIHYATSNHILSFSVSESTCSLWLWSTNLCSFIHRWTLSWDHFLVTLMELQLSKKDTHISLKITVFFYQHQVDSLLLLF